jgi:hypothetical protein
MVHEIPTDPRLVVGVERRTIVLSSRKFMDKQYPPFGTSRYVNWACFQRNIERQPSRAAFWWNISRSRQIEYDASNPSGYVKESLHSVGLTENINTSKSLAIWQSRSRDGYRVLKMQRRTHGVIWRRPSELTLAQGVVGGVNDDCGDSCVSRNVPEILLEAPERIVKQNSFLWRHIALILR